MPLHDWSKVPAGAFHDFHSSWIIHLKETLNTGLLPEGYYALAEQHAGRLITDVLTLQWTEKGVPRPESRGPLAVAEAPPNVGRKLVANPNAAHRAARKTLTVRHVSGHRIVALIEVISPANIDRPKSVQDVVRKAHAALDHGCHLFVADLFLPGPYDPFGIHGAIWEAFDPEIDKLGSDKPLSVASYVADVVPEAYLEKLSFGDRLPDMPLFLDVGFYVSLPLERTYQAAYDGVPDFWRKVIEA